MKNLFRVNPASGGTHVALLLIRVAIGVLMLLHGLPKMEMLLAGGPVQFPPVFGLSPAFSLSLAVFAEVVCSILVIVGLGIRLAVVPLIMTMLVAVLVIHAADPFAKQEMGILYLVSFVGLFFTGSGKYSLDYLLLPNKGRQVTANKSTDNTRGVVYQ